MGAQAAASNLAAQAEASNLAARPEAQRKIWIKLLDNRVEPFAYEDGKKISQLKKEVAEKMGKTLSEFVFFPECKANHTLRESGLNPSANPEKHDLVCVFRKRESNTDRAAKRSRVG